MQLAASSRGPMVGGVPVKVTKSAWLLAAAWEKRERDQLKEGGSQAKGGTD
ncbi:MAG: hypothetical protein OXC11_03280 [Rhodospirillales bacterium]|nr:hypothetical protein [Rhodospirillales bacterium]